MNGILSGSTLLSCLFIFVIPIASFAGTDCKQVIDDGSAQVGTSQKGAAIVENYYVGIYVEGSDLKLSSIEEASPRVIASGIAEDEEFVGGVVSEFVYEIPGSRDKWKESFYPVSGLSRRHVFFSSRVSSFNKWYGVVRLPDGFNPRDLIVYFKGRGAFLDGPEATLRWVVVGENGLLISPVLELYQLDATTPEEVNAVWTVESWKFLALHPEVQSQIESLKSAGDILNENDRLRVWQTNSRVIPNILGWN